MTPDPAPAASPSRWDRLRPSRHVPQFSWSSTGGRWQTRPLTLVVLVIGLWIFGTGDALIIEAGIGNTPWTVLAEGIGELTGLSVGVLTILIGAAVLLLWIPLGERPGLGTLANVVIIGVAIDVMRLVVPTPGSFPAQLAQSIAGTVAIGLGGALYLSAQLGPGPRDGWMTGLHRKVGWPITLVRLGIEVTVLALGYALGGTVGLGTVIFALAIGHTLGLWLSLMRHLDPTGQTSVMLEPE